VRKNLDLFQTKKESRLCVFQSHMNILCVKDIEGVMCLIVGLLSVDSWSRVVLKVFSSPIRDSYSTLCGVGVYFLRSTMIYDFVRSLVVTPHTVSNHGCNLLYLLSFSTLMLSAALLLSYCTTSS